ncbi:MAG: SRPBCC family protein [Acidobacteria bacterium]|nr:SRPBCC family protein [Acidobacteriota bacterium]
MAVEGTVQSIEVSAPPKKVFEVAIDYASYPDWVSGVKSVDILEELENGFGYRVEFVAEAMIKEISYVLVYKYESDTKFTWHAEPGADIRLLEGSYEFTEIEGGSTEVLYALRVDPAFVVPGFLRRQAEKQIVSSALRGLKRRAESL